MSQVLEVVCRPRGKRIRWFFVGLGAAGAGLATVHMAHGGRVLGMGPGIGLLLTLGGLASLYGVTARVSADSSGLQVRTLLGRRSVPWHDIADLRVRLKYAHTSRSHETRRVILVLRDGRKRLLPLPRSWSADDPDFEAQLTALRALHRRHGTPGPGHVLVVSEHTAGRGWAGSLVLCALLLAGSGLAAWFVPSAASDERAWRSAVPCATGTPANERSGSALPERGRGAGEDCLTTVRAVIARTEARQPKQRSWVYFTDRRPIERLEVSYEAAEAFEAGDKVELTVWRGQVREVAGAHYVWREHMTTSGEVATVAAGAALAAGYPGALLLLRLRGRRLPDDEVLPSVLPFAGALAGTALWLLPLCYLHPTTLLSSPATITWAAAGSLVTLGLFVWAWRVTRIRPPETAEETGGTEAAGGSGDQETEVFLAARFLEHTDYNPHHFGTHIVLGGGSPPAVTPHPGPGRFAAKRIPVERLTVGTVRRPRGGDGDTIPTSWHIAELDDAGRPVRLAAAPADLTRILRALSSVGATVTTAAPGS
ncbi:PH domain-containing protein [Streptomyces sp. NPDC052036]|uniref:PH domain-containing protein n=1 Tax=Streptomyces sp. NPDC052036 TaxID=3155171 RepID=UPI00341BD681